MADDLSNETQKKLSIGKGFNMGAPSFVPSAMASAFVPSFAVDDDATTSESPTHVPVGLPTSKKPARVISLSSSKPVAPAASDAPARVISLSSAKPAVPSASDAPAKAPASAAAVNATTAQVETATPKKVEKGNCEGARQLLN